MKEVQLTRRLTLEEVQRIPDGAGGFSENWISLGTLWADIRAGSGRERAEDVVTLSRVPYRITVRATAFGAPSRPRPDQRLREGVRLFRILAVAEHGADRRFLDCFTEEEVPT